ncbi:MAG: hypothetical protein M1819_006299 [Sarea resinae]|nr:MAG: hypothetical protein M1819_006299 [Sarea resinae]
MASPHLLRARLQFLHDTAHVLFATSPAISSHLLATSTSLALENDVKLPDARRRDFCNGCGNIMIPGYSSQIATATTTTAAAAGRTRGSHVRRGRREGQRRPKGKRAEKETQHAPHQPRSAIEHKPNHARSAKELIHTCDVCGRKTRQPIPPPPPPPLRRKAKPKPRSAAQSQPSRETSEPVSTSANRTPSGESEKPASINAGSKKRAKARKRGGLQALIAKTKTEQSSPSAIGEAGFGLDLMDLMKSG